MKCTKTYSALPKTNNNFGIYVTCKTVLMGEKKYSTKHKTWQSNHKLKSKMVNLGECTRNKFFLYYTFCIPQGNTKK